jgi:2-polyprenyl-3-methyl-5-hydroxy-6-metoxy-1,4-benzoquinol methylase
MKTLNANETFNPDSYWENRLDKIKGLEGVGFKKLGPAFNKWAYKVRRNVFLKQVNFFNFDIKNNKVLDIGSGTGFYIQIWNELKAAKITGIDISPTAIDTLKKTFPLDNFFLSDIGAENFNEPKNFEKYDLISCMDVLFHIVDDTRFEQSIKNISSILNSGGHFIYSDFYLHSEPIRGESQVSRSKKYLMAVFEKNDFELVLHKPFMYYTNKPVDTKNPVIKFYWFCLENLLYVLPFMGHVMGPLIYPLEMRAVNKGENSPTTEFTIFRKK